PSLQLAGDDRPLDLAALRACDVRVLGRLAGIEDGTVHLAGDLAETMHAADAKLARILTRIEAAMLPHELGPREPVPAIGFDAKARSIDLIAEGIGTVIWATGFRRAWPWLRVPVLDAAGEIVHRGGVTPAPGLFTLGMPFQRRRKSTFIDGAGGDARALLPNLLRQLQSRPRAAA